MNISCWIGFRVYFRIANFIHLKIKLNQGISKGLGKAPHKPILILAVIEAFERGIITENRIYITPELLSLFKSYWYALVKTGHTANFTLPFFHLKNEKPEFWFLQSAPGFESAITSSNSIKSFKALNEFVYYAYLSEEMYGQMSNQVKRLELKQYILFRYFGKTSVSLGYDALGEAENDILQDDSATYRNKVIASFESNIEEQEEERFIRGNAFKKAIPRIYQNMCAISGLKVDATFNISMIDACHIIPFSESYNDTIQNGIALCPNLHRAFDRGLISINEKFQVMVSNKFIENDSQYGIHQFEGKHIWLSDESKYHPSQGSLANHRKRFGF